eukprot:1439472-Rhodomonas_salina.1
MEALTGWCRSATPFPLVASPSLDSLHDFPLRHLLFLNGHGGELLIPIACESFHLLPFAFPDLTVVTASVSFAAGAVSCVVSFWFE